jgi:hypothetical protein
MRIVALICLSLVSWSCRGSRPGPDPGRAPQGDAEVGFGGWLSDQNPPETDPRLFAPLQVSTGRGERCITFSPDMTELFHQRNVRPGVSSIVIREIEDGSWTQGNTAPFAGVTGRHDCGPAFTDEGDTLVFYSNRPAGPDAADRRDFNFWSITRSKSGWTPPRALGPEINSPFDDEDISFTSGGVASFSSSRTGDYDIYRTQLGQNGDTVPERLGASVNSPFFDGHPCIAPDESFLIFSSGGRPDEIGNADLYVSFRDSSDNWSPARILDARINTTSHEAAPTLSPDGKYLDVYWVDIKIIEDFRPRRGAAAAGSSRD